MKALLTTIFLLTSLILFGQFSEKHLLMLSKINCELSDIWNVEFKPQKASPFFFNLPLIEITLLSYKTVDSKGNMGISIRLIQKPLGDTIKKILENPKSNRIMIETKTYQVIIGYFDNGNDMYKKMTAVLIKELEVYFQKNKNEL